MFNAVKTKLSESNSSRIEVIFQLETRELKNVVGNHFTTQEKLRIIVSVVYNDQYSATSNPLAAHLNSIFTAKNGPKGKP